MNINLKSGHIYVFECKEGLKDCILVIEYDPAVGYKIIKAYEGESVCFSDFEAVKFLSNFNDTRCLGVLDRAPECQTVCTDTDTLQI